MKNEMRARWMVVDCDAQALDTISRLLSTVTDAEICCYSSPWQALDAFADAPDAFQFVVTDFEMPGLNGVDLRRHLHAVTPSLNVLLTTAGGMFNIESALQNGFCGLLTKPFSINSLRLALEFARLRNANFSGVNLMQ
jgi:FixJ family two-component response regulator